MAGEDKTILVYDDFSSEAPILLGRLYIGVLKGVESYSFEYDKEWLAKNEFSTCLDPELQSVEGRQFPSKKNIFGMFADSSPDRWGVYL